MLQSMRRFTFQTARLQTKGKGKDGRNLRADSDDSAPTVSKGTSFRTVSSMPLLVSPVSFLGQVGLLRCAQWSPSGGELHGTMSPAARRATSPLVQVQALPATTLPAASASKGRSLGIPGSREMGSQSYCQARST